MAVVETVRKRAVTLQLENGMDDEGNYRYVSQSLGGLSKDNWDADKIMNIKDGIAPLFSKTVGFVQTVTTSELARQN